MDDTTLIQRLGGLEPPRLDEARENAAATLERRLRTARAGVRRERRGGRLRLAFALAAAATVVAGFAVLTPPGRAFTSWVGERIGLGEPGGHPTLQSLRHFATSETAAAGQPAYVLVSGPVPGGGGYELVTYRNRREPGKGWPADGGRCFELELTGAASKSLFGQGCGLPKAEAGLLATGGANSGPPGGRPVFVVDGRASADVASVEVSLDGHKLPVQLRPVPDWLIQRLQIRRPFKFFIAVLRQAPRARRLTVVARDAGGRGSPAVACPWRALRCSRRTCVLLRLGCAGRAAGRDDLGMSESGAFLRQSGTSYEAEVDRLLEDDLEAVLAAGGLTAADVTALRERILVDE